MHLPYVTEVPSWQTTGQQSSMYTLTEQGLCYGTSGQGATWPLCNSKFSQAFQSESSSGVRYAVHPGHVPSLLCSRQNLVAFITCPVSWCFLLKPPQENFALLVCFQHCPLILGFLLYFTQITRREVAQKVRKQVAGSHLFVKEEV